MSNVPAEKYCPACNVIKSSSSFYKASGRYDGLRAWCKSCQSTKNKIGKYYSSEWAKIRFQDFSNFIADIKDVPCMDCGVKYPPVCMDFDHRDPTLKTFNIATGATRRRELVIQEIAKCDIVCANCHRIRTWRKE